MVSRKWTIQLSFELTLPIEAAAPPSAMTVCALPNSDLEMIAVRLAGQPGLDGGAQAGAAGTDDDDVVRVPLIMSRHVQSAPQLMKRRSENQPAETAIT